MARRNLEKHLQAGKCIEKGKYMLLLVSYMNYNNHNKVYEFSFIIEY